MPHKTHDFDPEDLMDLIESTKAQDDRVMLIFKSKNKDLTPRQCYEAYRAWFVGRIELTSVRRSISDLTTCTSLRPVMETYLDKSGQMHTRHKKVKNSLGGIEHYWELNTPQQ